jgi:hypothetical protein
MRKLFATDGNMLGIRVLVHAKIPFGTFSDIQWPTAVS